MSKVLEINRAIYSLELEYQRKYIKLLSLHNPLEVPEIICYFSKYSQA